MNSNPDTETGNFFKTTFKLNQFDSRSKFLISDDDLLNKSNYKRVTVIDKDYQDIYSNQLSNPAKNYYQVRILIRLPTDILVLTLIVKYYLIK